MNQHSRAREVAIAERHIAAHLDRPILIAELADLVGLSPFHFQRLFLQGLGESVSVYIRRRRLEQAAKLLTASSPPSVIDIAISVGFESHSAFSRAFKSQYGCSPSDFPSHAHREVPAVDFDKRAFLTATGKGTSLLEPDIQSLPPLWLLFREQAGVSDGSYFQQSAQMGHDLAALTAMPDSSLWGTGAAYRGGPAGFNDQHAVGCYGGLFTAAPALEWSDLCTLLPAGNWAVINHFGSFEFLYQSWNKAVRNWLPGSGFVLRDPWAFERYLESPSRTSADTLSARIYLPVKAL